MPRAQGVSSPWGAGDGRWQAGMGVVRAAEGPLGEEGTPRRQTPGPACSEVQSGSRCSGLGPDFLSLPKSVSVSIKDLKPHLSGDFFFKPLKMFIFIQLHVMCFSSSQDASVPVGGWVTRLHPLGKWR